MHENILIMGILVSVLTAQPALAGQTAITEQEARVIRVIAYLYFYPLVTLTEGL